MIIRKPLPCCLPRMQTHISLHRILLFAEALLIGYNKKCRNPLPWDKLYTHKLPQKKADEPEPEEETDDMPQSEQLDLFGLGDDEEVSE